jgi:hypothetical protein
LPESHRTLGRQEEFEGLDVEVSRELIDVISMVSLIPGSEEAGLGFVPTQIVNEVRLGLMAMLEPLVEIPIVPRATHALRIPAIGNSVVSTA